MPRVKRRTKARSAALSAALEQFLLKNCGRIGVFMHLGEHPDYTQLMNDPAARDAMIRETWQAYQVELFERWSVEHPGVEPSIVAYLREYPTPEICEIKHSHQYHRQRMAEAAKEYQNARR